MKRSIIQIVVLALVIFLAQFVLPWYALVILTFMYGLLLADNWRRAFFVSFLAVFLVWALYPLAISMQDGFRLAGVIGDVFGGLPGGLIVGVNGLVFGLLGGLAGLSGSLFKSLRSVDMGS